MKDDLFKGKLSPEAYRVLREKGTEAPGTGQYLHSKDKGMYRCAACGTELFSSDAKFDSGTGWPSFDSVIQKNVILREDTEHGMRRTEAICKNCESHLGHVFSDGPTKTGERFCINSVCLSLDSKEDTHHENRQ
jgi:peptide-methionine (R)-S-oxide reductase